MIRILQFHGDAYLHQVLSGHFRHVSDVVYQGRSGYTGRLDCFAGAKPDLILLDLDLQPQGGLALLAEIRARCSREEVKVLLLVAEETPEHVLTDAARLGADYCMHFPIDLSVLETRIRQLVRAPQVQGDVAVQEVTPLTRRQVQEKCTKYFEYMGIPPHYKGYRYLIEGVWLASLHPSWLNAVTGHLYPAIGEHFQVNASQVERAMRYALDVTWEKGNMDQLYELFPFVKESTGKPTNSDFIATMVDFMRSKVSEVV